MSHCARVQELCIHVTLRAAHTHARAHAHIRVEVTLPNVRESPQEARICPLPAPAPQCTRARLITKKPPLSTGPVGDKRHAAQAERDGEGTPN